MLDLPPEIERILRAGRSGASVADRERVEHWLAAEPQLAWLVGLTRRYLRLAPEEVEDTLQEFWETALAGVLRNVDLSKGGLAPYLSVSLRNFCKKYLREIQNRERMERPYPVISTEEGTIEVDFEDEEAENDPAPLEAVECCMNVLSNAHRLVVRLHYWEDLSIAEIAAKLGFREVTVKVRLHRARQALRPCLVRGQCIQALPPPHRQVLILHEIRGKHLTQVAAATRASLDEVRSRLDQGRRLVSQCIKERL